MQSTSALYKTIVADPNHWIENRLVITGVGTFAETQLFSVETTGNTVENKPQVGHAVSGEVNIKMVNPSATIPRMAELKPQYRAVRINNGTQETSEWLAKGVYYIDTRSISQGASEEVLTMHGYDAMLKGEQDYPSSGHDWPYIDKSVVAEIASAIGVSVDARTNEYLTAGYMIGLPLGYTIREVLSQIAGAYGGNFIISNEGKLLFVPLYGFDPSIIGNYLADENGNALVFGNEGWYILV